MDKAKQMHSAFSELRRRILAVAKRHPDELAEITDLVERLEDLQEQVLTATAETQPAESAPRRGTYGRRKHYYRTTSTRGPCLAETWKGARQAILVPQEMYLEAAQLLGAQRKPVSFDELLGQLRQRHPDAGEYILRTCLRFWRQTDPPLVNLVRRRYEVPSPETFTKDADAAWQDLPEQTTEQ